MGNEDLCRRVQDFLKSKCKVPSMKVPDAWINGCVSWYKNSHPNSSMQDLFEFVAQQWVLVDFVQLRLKSLPDNLQKSELINLKENYILQLMYVINIGQSAYSQHTKITQGLESNSDVSADKKIPSKWEPKSRRMLLIHLTDGSQNIQAMEYMPIPSIHLDLIPGTKILIKGPVECRRGVILLRSENIELLGGEVSDLVQPNAPENVLARVIGKPENPNPVYGSYTMQTSAGNDMEQDGDDEFSSSGVSCSGIKESQRQASSRPVFGGGGGDLNHHHQNPPAFAGSAREKRTLSSANTDCPPAKKIQPDRRPTLAPARRDDDMFPDDDDDFLMADIPLEPDLMVPESRVERQTAPEAKTKPLPMQPAPSLSSSSSSLTTPSTVSGVTVQRAQPAAVDRPFTYLSTHLRRRATNSNSRSIDTVCVKGFVSTIRSKLEVKAGKWRLSATVNDGSAALDVDFSPDILEMLIGHSPTELKSLMATRDDETRRLAQQALENAKQKLIRLNCLLHIRWPSDGQLPVVYRLEEIERRHLEMLQLL